MYFVADVEPGDAFQVLNHARDVPAEDERRLADQRELAGPDKRLHGVHAHGLDADQHLCGQRHWPVYLSNLQYLGTAESLLNNGMHALEHRDSLVRNATDGGCGRGAGPRRAGRRLVPILRREAATGYPQRYCTLRMFVARPAGDLRSCCRRARQRRGAQIAEDLPKCLATGALVRCGGRAGAGDDVAELVAAGYPELGVGPVQVRADRAR